MAQVARKHGKFAGTVANPDNLEQLLDLGYTFLNIGADVTGLNSYCRSLMEEFQKRVSGAALSNLLL